MTNRIHSLLLAGFVLLMTLSGQICHAQDEVSAFSRIATTSTHDLPGMLEKRSIRVLTSFSPTMFFMDKGKVYGFEYKLLKEYEKFLNKNRPRKKEIHIEFIPVPSNKLIPFLKQGYGDVVAALTTITPQRQKKVSFTAPYLPNVKEVIVTNADVQGIETLEDLSGRSVMVRKSSSFNQSLTKLNASLAQKGRKPVTILAAPEFEPTESILEMVNAGIVEITVTDNYLANIWKRVFTDIHVRNDLIVRNGGQIAWMVRPDNPKLLASLNAFVKTIRKGTLLGNIYFNKYYKSDKILQHPLDEDWEIEKFTEYTPLFKKYAKMYGLDWRLLAALAYQESQFNHEARSHVGAVGIMQIMPSLATDTRLGIADIHDLEQNIHLGAKYLALLRDRYFPKKDIASDAERLRFALASYNAGPTRIRKARREAEKLGFDNNIWFHNTEYGAMRLAGMEPVRYVTSINMYYQAMLLSEELIKARNLRKQESRK